MTKTLRDEKPQQKTEMSHAQRRFRLQGDNCSMVNRIVYSFAFQFEKLNVDAPVVNSISER